MDYTFLIATVSISLIVPLVLRMMSRTYSNDDDSSCIIKYPRSMFYISVICTLVCVLAYILAIIQIIQDGISNNVPVTVFCSVATMIFVSLGSWLTLRVLFWKIKFENCIVHRNLFGRTSKYEYCEITKIYKYCNRSTELVTKYKLFFGKRKIVVDMLVMNFESFERLIKKYAKKSGISVQFEVKQSII